MAEDGAFPAKTVGDWAQLASGELRGKPLDIAMTNTREV